MYPQSADSETDVMAANEVATHVTLQQRQDSQYLYHLLGGFEVQDPESGPGREQVSEMKAHVVLIVAVKSYNKPSSELSHSSS